MSRAAPVGALAVVLVVGLTGGACSAAAGDRPVVFAASSLAVVTDEIDAALEARGDTPPEWILAGSRRLVDQILDGAQPDIIVTADLEALQPVLDAGLGYVQVVSRAGNRLVLAVAPGNPASIEDLDDLSNPDSLIGWCAEQVPCGRLARKVADEHGLSIAADTEEPSVRSLARKIAAGELDAGLVYRTDAIAFGLETVDDTRLADATTTYAMAVRAPEADQAAGPLVSFLAGSAEVLAPAGFEVVEDNR